jgi:tetratricopeptide (TPR) repeat protein
MKRSDLLLAPAISSNYRNWLTLPKGSDCCYAARRYLEQHASEAVMRGNSFECPLPCGDASSFTLAIKILDRLRDSLNDSACMEELSSLAEQMRATQTAEAGLDTATGLEAAVLRNGDALAALRRVSRESATSSTLIDQAARAMNKACRLLGYRSILVFNADAIDRPSLKFLTRACLLASPDAPVFWVWTQIALPDPHDDQLDLMLSSLPVKSRQNILDAIITVLQPLRSQKIQRAEKRMVSTALHIDSRGVGGATAWLANLNYDACAMWAAAHNEHTPDYYRLAALLLTNIGLHNAALTMLEKATEVAGHATLRAHIWYISGLIWSKRLYDVATSNACFERAECELDSVQANDPGDPDMERAWVQNGRAMNAILAARLEGRSIRQIFTNTFHHLTSAFDMVREGHTRDRVYLRYNLLGNMSSLMEIGGNYDVALNLLNRTFDESLAKGVANEREWLAQQRCQRAALQARSGDVKAAVPIFSEARTLLLAANRPVCAETLGRSCATALFKTGQTGAAREIFADCLEEARLLRSRIGVEIHTTGLAASYLVAGDIKKARSIVEEIGHAENVWCLSRDKLQSGDFSGLAIKDNFYGLTMSIPEIDLEDMAPASIAGALRGRVTEVQSARAVRA